MAHRSTLPSLALAVAALAAACGGGSNVSNASPRVDEVPLQSTTGATTFALDLGDYVSDREGAPLTYAVASGGGSFAGSVYSHTFDTMGRYTIAFTVDDGAKTSTGSFVVEVTAANLVVVEEDANGLLLLDSRTNAFVRVAGASTAPTFATGLGDGRLVYGLAAPGGSDLLVFDPLTRTNVELAEGEDGTVTYRGETSDGRVLFTAGDSIEQTLSVFNPRTGLQLPIAIGQLSGVAVNTQDLVFYEAAVNGQTDVWLYDSEENEAQAVADDARAETVAGVLPNGGVVIARVGGGGETDLWYFERGTGLVEIGADVAAIATANKGYAACSTDGKVVFTAVAGGVSDLYSWDPTDGQTTSLSAAFGAGAFDVFVAIGSGNEVVWNRVVGGSEADAYFYDLDSSTSGTVRDGADVSEVLGVSSDGTTAYAFVRPSGTPSSVLAVSLIGTPATATWAAGGAVATALGRVANGDVVAQRQDGTALARFDVSAGAWGTAITGVGLTFAGDGLDDGDFVYSLTASSQTDLSMWDASASASVVVSDTTGNDTYQARTADGTLLFTRVVSGNATADLFVWDGAETTQLTQADAASLLHDHTVLGTYQGTR
jgi:hypothetical protein